MKSSSQDSGVLKRVNRVVRRKKRKDLNNLRDNGLKKKKSKSSFVDQVNKFNENRQAACDSGAVKKNKKITSGRLTVAPHNQDGIFLKGARAPFVFRQQLNETNTARKDENLMKIIDIGRGGAPEELVRPNEFDFKNDVLRELFNVTNKRKSTREERGSTEDKRESAEDRRAREESGKSMEEGGMCTGERINSAVDRRKSALEKRKSAVERRECAVEKRKFTEEKRKSALEMRKSAVERRECAVEKRKFTEEKRKSALEKRNSAVERRECAVEKRKFTEEKRKSALEMRKSADSLHAQRNDRSSLRAVSVFDQLQDLNRISRHSTLVDSLGMEEVHLPSSISEPSRNKDGLSSSSSSSPDTPHLSSVVLSSKSSSVSTPPSVGPWDRPRNVRDNNSLPSTSCSNDKNCACQKHQHLIRMGLQTVHCELAHSFDKIAKKFRMGHFPENNASLRPCRKVISQYKTNTEMLMEKERRARCQTETRSPVENNLMSCNSFDMKSPTPRQKKNNNPATLFDCMNWSSDEEQKEPGSRSTRAHFGSPMVLQSDHSQMYRDSYRSQLSSRKNEPTVVIPGNSLNFFELVDFYDKGENVNGLHDSATVRLTFESRIISPQRHDEEHEQATLECTTSAVHSYILQRFFFTSSWSQKVSKDIAALLINYVHNLSAVCNSHNGYSGTDEQANVNHTSSSGGNLSLPHTNMDDDEMRLSRDKSLGFGNTYSARKTVAQGMMDIALMTANANQLRYLMEYNSKSPTFTVCLSLLIFSIGLQVCVGVALIFKGRHDLQGNGKTDKSIQLNNFVVFGVFLITVTNVFIASFTVQNPSTSG